MRLGWLKSKVEGIQVIVHSPETLGVPAVAPELPLLVHSITEALPDGLVVVDTSGFIVLVNAQAELMFGYHRSELIGQTIEMLVPERLRKRHIHHRDAYSTLPHVRTMGVGMQLEGRRKDGREVPVEIMLSPMVTPLGIYSLVLIRRSRIVPRGYSEMPSQAGSVPELSIESSRPLED